MAATGDRAALGQLALKLTAPGVPDTYNGDELPYRALVDPDNRRPVDWDRRRELLARVGGGADPDDETRKLWLIRCLLQLRARRPDAFDGDYQPLESGGEVCAFVRGGEVLVAVAVRDGAEFELPEGDWQEVLPGLWETHGITVLEHAAR